MLMGHFGEFVCSYFVLFECVGWVGGYVGR